MLHTWKFFPSNSFGGSDPTDPVSACENCGEEASETESLCASGLETLLIDACQILDVVKQEWSESWSDFDQSVRDRMSQVISYLARNDANLFRTEK